MPNFLNAAKYSRGTTIFLAWRMIAPFPVQDCVKRLFFLRDCDSLFSGPSLDPFSAVLFPLPGKQRHDISFVLAIWSNPIMLACKIVGKSNTAWWPVPCKAQKGRLSYFCKCIGIICLGHWRWKWQSLKCKQYEVKALTLPHNYNRQPVCPQPFYSPWPTHRTLDCSFAVRGYNCTSHNINLHVPK